MASAASAANINGQLGRPFRRTIDSSSEFWRIIYSSWVRNGIYQVDDILHDRKEPFDHLKIVHHGGCRQGRDEPPAVTFCAQSGIENGEHPPVAAVTDETPQALLQGEYRERHLVFIERCPAARADGIDAGGRHRI